MRGGTKKLLEEKHENSGIVGSKKRSYISNVKIEMQQVSCHHWCEEH